jgi:Fe2+ or Zn2+ uptake regulation protein
MATDLHATAAARLREDGQRYTANRRALVEALEAAEHPLTIPELLARRADMPQSSAYRNLAVLERAGVVDKLVTADEFARFELAEDLTEHHHHLICDGCGSVADLPADPELEALLDTVVARAAAATGFRVDAHRVDLVGRCADCAG